MTLCERCVEADPHHPHDDCGDKGCLCDCRPMVVVSVRLTQAEYAALKARADEECRSLGQQARRDIKAVTAGGVPRITAKQVEAEHITVHQDASPCSSVKPSRTRAALELLPSPETQDQPQDQLLSSPDGDRFEEAWEAYPRHHETRKPGGGAAKAEARKRWAKVKPKERGEAITGIRHYAAEMSRSGAFVAHFTTWVNQRRWEDWQEPATPQNGARASPNGQRPNFYVPTEADYLDGAINPWSPIT